MASNNATHQGTSRQGCKDIAVPKLRPVAPSVYDGYSGIHASDARRRAIAEYAIGHGIKETTRHFGCSRETVRRWKARIGGVT